MSLKNEEIEILKGFCNSMNNYKDFLISLIKKRCEHNFIFNISTIVRPNIEIIKSFISKNNKQFLKINEIFIKKDSPENYFNLKSFIQERVDFETLF